MCDRKFRPKNYSRGSYPLENEEGLSAVHRESNNNVIYKPYPPVLVENAKGIQNSDLPYCRELDTTNDGQPRHSRKGQVNGSSASTSRHVKFATLSESKSIANEEDQLGDAAMASEGTSTGGEFDDANTGLNNHNKLECGDSNQFESVNLLMSKVRLESGDEPQAIMLAPKKKPAVRDNLEKVNLLTNFWKLEVQNKIVYRYEVAIHLGTPTNQKAVNLLRGARDDSSTTSRRKLCLNLVHHALDVHRILSEGAATVCDGGSMLFSSEDLTNALKEHNGILVLVVSHLPSSIQKLVSCVDAESVTIEIDFSSATSFNMADLSTQMNRNLDTVDQSLKQFYDLLTNQDALISGRFTQLGIGCLYYRRPSPEKIGYGYQCFSGVRKGVKFIEGKRRDPNDIVAALVLDYRISLFFTSQNLMRSVRELDGLRDVQQFDFSRVNSQMNRKWNQVDHYVKGVRINCLDSSVTNPLSFVAIGISNRPIRELMDTLPNAGHAEVSVLEKFSRTGVYLNPDWPAVLRRSQNGVQYFPMELLEVARNQRVPLEKQLIAKNVGVSLHELYIPLFGEDKKLVTDNPQSRFSNIYNLLEALNLHDNGLANNFLRAFGLVVSRSPLQVEGFRRRAPGIFYGAKQSCKIDRSDYSWHQDPGSRYVEPGHADQIIVLHSDPTNELPTNVIIALQRTFRVRGVFCGKFVPIRVGDEEAPWQIETDLENIFKQYRDLKESLLIIYIDRTENKYHDFLKLLERKYLLPTQQITAELAERLPRQNRLCTNFVMKTNLKLGGVNYEVIPETFAKDRWIGSDKTLIVGYDVCHPGKPTKDEIVNRIPPQKPSVVGISFNGAVHPECFIGDYHFQAPHQEKVDRKVLIARFKWILETFTQNRRIWPEVIMITRDGVSEGQYRMVIEHELSAIKEACYEFGELNGRESWQPKFTVIVATKRHNARFVADGARLENPKPATVIDTDVVRNDLTEFYMQTHKPVKGTAKSTAYQVIVDENNMSMDEVQSLILALTFHHQITNHPISLPEPVYQADEWAKRGKNIWNAYSSRYDFILENKRGKYSDFPIDFEAMTNRLAYWNTRLQNRRMNA
ncbi:hypothetical protein KIN20_035490 [Parelaphostrongylus tenuis]|uniref:Piwi domain-containing protein n=1 Tax=Parelaphostrongylus tenuis TaxID=148309 RepID=A0AAD5RB99_PARTN|nr:hypothetical protein KIN20_035490 [Parelaphostrongylus tenuis]